VRCPVVPEDSPRSLGTGVLGGAAPAAEPVPVLFPEFEDST
jgi:hypothetical protein